MNPQIRELLEKLHQMLSDLDDAAMWAIEIELVLRADDQAWHPYVVTDHTTWPTQPGQEYACLTLYNTVVWGDWEGEPSWWGAVKAWRKIELPPAPKEKTR